MAILLQLYISIFSFTSIFEISIRMSVYPVPPVPNCFYPLFSSVKVAQVK